MLYIRKRGDNGHTHFFVDIIETNGYVIKRGDCFIGRGKAFQVIDVEQECKIMVIRWIEGAELSWDMWHPHLPWTLFTNNPVVSTDSQFMPTSIGPDHQGKVRTTVTRHPDDPRKIISLHSKFLPMANYYNTACLAKTTSESNLKELKKKGLLEILPHKVRFGTSAETVKLEMAKELPEGTDMDDVQFYVSEIF